MKVTIDKIKPGKIKEVRAEYNKMFKLDKSNDFFTEEQIAMLEDINKQRFIRILVEYRRVKYEMENQKKYAGHKLILKLDQEPSGTYRFSFYETDYRLRNTNLLLVSLAHLTKNEVETFLYVHSKDYPNMIIDNLGDYFTTNSIFYSSETFDIEFLCTTSINQVLLGQLQSMLQVYEEKKSYQLHKNLQF